MPRPIDPIAAQQYDAGADAYWAGVIIEGWDKPRRQQAPYQRGWNDMAKMDNGG